MESIRPETIPSQPGMFRDIQSHKIDGGARANRKFKIIKNYNRLVLVIILV